MTRKAADVAATERALDLVIECATVHDGTGRVPFTADVGVRGDRIAALGDLSGVPAARRIDARGLAVCPGFIDVHSHADMVLVRPDHATILEPLVRQGITTFVGGNCGVAMAPIVDSARSDLYRFYDFFLGAPQDDNIRWTTFGGMMDTIESQGCLLNAAVLAPHGIVRICAMGDSDVPAAAPDIDAMTRLLHECFDAGAIGMSTGLQYFPGLCSDTGELLRLADVVHDRDGVFTSHLRSYNQSTMERALDEVITVCRTAEVPVQVSHLFIVPEFPFRLFEAAKVGLRALSRLYAYRPFHAPLGGILQSFVDRATRHADAGLPIGFDAMPTSAAFTHLLAFFPPWSVRGGFDRMLERLKDRATRAQIRHSIEHGETRWPHRGPDSWSLNLIRLLGYDCIVVMSLKSDANQRLIGKSLAQIARERGCHPFDAACDLLIEENGRVLTFETATHPGDDFAEMAQEDTYLDPHVSIVTDTILLGFGMPSHLFYDCYPRFLSRYARDRKLLTLAEAIRKCTSLPASQLGIRDRGIVRQGLFADLVVFDPDTLASRSTPLEPARFPEGIRWVLINGKPVVEPDRVNLDAKAGRLLRKGA